MSRRRVLALAGRALIAVLAIAASLAACSAQPETGAGHSPGGAAVQMNPGELTYMRSCSRCHGTDRMGKTDAPKLDSVRIASLGEQPLRMTIQYGKGRMEGFGGLTQQQVDDLVAFLRQ